MYSETLVKWECKQGKPQDVGLSSCLGLDVPFTEQSFGSKLPAPIL